MWKYTHHIGEGRGTRLIAEHGDPGRIARVGYTYLHMPIVAGIVLAAVGDDLALRHPMDPAGVAQLAALLGGPALYLAGLGAFKRLSLGWMPLSHSVGLAAFGLVAVLGQDAPLLAIAAAATAILIAVAVWEHLSLHGGDTA
jgi:low temperature requirement protein LtrA